MDNMNIRFCDTNGKTMVKFCDEHIVISCRGEEGFVIPYECICKILYERCLLSIIANDGVDYCGYKVDEELKVKKILEMISNKINQKTTKKPKITQLSEEDKRFIDIAKKAKTGNLLTEEENIILGDFVEKRDEKTYQAIQQRQKHNSILLRGYFLLIAVAISLFGGFLYANNYPLAGMILIVLGALTSTLFISIHTKTTFGISFIIVLIITFAINFALFGMPQKTPDAWEQLTEEEQDEIRENMEFWEGVNKAKEKYEKR